MKRLIIAAGAAAITMLAGCATPAATKSEASTAQHVDESVALLQEARAAQAEKIRRPLVRTEEAIYVAPKQMLIREALPEVFGKRVYFVEPLPLPLSIAAERISLVSGYRVLINDDVYASLKSHQTEQSGAAGNATALLASGGAKGQSSNVDVNSLIGFASREGEISINLNYDGPLTALLDRVASSVGASWRFVPDTGVVEFYRFESHTYPIHAIPGQTTVNSAITNQSGGGSSTGGGTSTSGNNQVSMTASFNLFASVKEAVGAMLTKDGGTFTLSPESGVLVVTDTPQVHQRVSDYVKNLNDVMGREVVAEVQVLSVLLSDDDQRGINWDAVYQTASGSLNLLTQPTSTGAGRLTASVLSTASGSAARFAGSSAIIDALAKQGRVSSKTSYTLRTLNHQPAPLQVANKVSYVANSSTTNTNAGVTTSVDMNELTVGFTLTMIPHVLEDNKSMLMQMAVNLSQLDDLVTINAGQTVVQAPNITSRDIVQRVSMQSGQVLVLSGFERVSNDLTSDSISPNAKAWELGGNLRAKRRRELIVILVTPTILDGAWG